MQPIPASAGCGVVQRHLQIVVAEEPIESRPGFTAPPDVTSYNELNHFLGTDEAVVEDHLRFHSDLLRQSLQTGSIDIALATQDVRMSRACDDVHDVLVPGENLRQSLNHIFDSLVRGKQ